MAYTKIIESTIEEGKSAYTSVTLANKFTELQNSGDLTITYEILSNGNKRTTQAWRDESTFNSFISWLNSSGELAKMQAYHSSNNITVVAS